MRLSDVTRIQRVNNCFRFSYVVAYSLHTTTESCRAEFSSFDSHHCENHPEQAAGFKFEEAKVNFNLLFL